MPRACMTPFCPYEATGKMRTCDNCRASAHRWEKRHASEIIKRAQALRLYSGRMSLFAVIDVNKEDVTLLDHDALAAKGIMKFREVKAKAKSAAAQVKTRQAKAKARSRATTPARPAHA